MAHLHLDCFSGVAGDMLLGALIDLGGDPATVDGVVEALGLEGVEVSCERAMVGGIAAQNVEVTVEAGQPVRGLAEIESLIEASGVPATVRRNALGAFGLLASAEARVHGTTPEQVHFHEVGAADALVDVVGTCALMEALGVDSASCGSIATGSGETASGHGTIPVPGPATALLLEGHLTHAGPERVELATPTGAALVAWLCASTEGQPDLRAEATGHGAGTFPTVGLPNVLRATLGELAPAAAEGGLEVRTLALLEANLDDATAEAIAHAAQRLLEEGARDAWQEPIVMKKGRLGTKLCALVDPALEGSLRDLILAETPTLGVRRRLVARAELPRAELRVETPYGPVRVKRATAPGGALRLHPEHEDCARLAREHGVALRQVSDAARSAALAASPGG